LFVAATDAAKERLLAVGSLSLRMVGWLVKAFAFAFAFAFADTDAHGRELLR